MFESILIGFLGPSTVALYIFAGVSFTFEYVDFKRELTWFGKTMFILFSPIIILLWTLAGTFTLVERTFDKVKIFKE